MQLCSKSWILILKCIWKKQLSMCIQNWSHSAARPPKFSRVNEVVVSSTQPLEMTQIYLNDEVPCEGLENLCSILCFLVICLFYWQAATNVCAFPPGLQEEIHRNIHRKKTLNGLGRTKLCATLKFARTQVWQIWSVCLKCPPETQ